MANIFLISDTHFSHEKMLRHIGFGGPDDPGLREFASVEEMDETIIDRWNATVKDSDHIYHLGDVAIRKEHLWKCHRLKGHKRLVLGNHDIFEPKHYTEHFDKLFGTRVIDDLVLSHVPLHPDSVKQRWHGCIHGHLHKRPNTLGSRYLNVCVEMINYTPIALEDAKSQLLKQQGK